MMREDMRCRGGQKDDDADDDNRVQIENASYRTDGALRKDGER